MQAILHKKEGFLTRVILREKEMLFGAVCVGKNILHKKSIFGRFCGKRIFYKGDFAQKNDFKTL